MINMAISEAAFKDTFRKVMSSEFSEIPKDEDSIEFTFSKQFDKRMDKLIKLQRKIYYHLINSIGKRIAVACVVLITLLAATFSVDAIRDPVVCFVKKIFANHLCYTAAESTVGIISKEYIMTWLPEGFSQNNKTQDDSMITTEYTYGSDNIIVFTQWAASGFGGFSIDNEHSEICTEIIDNVEVTFQTSNNAVSAFWGKNGYAFEINSYGDADKDTIKRIIENIE